MQAFTRCVQQEPDNGEGWNNIAAIHLQLQHAPEAFSALSEAVKYKRDSWQTWANYGQAAAQTGNNLPAARAVQKASSLPIDLDGCLLTCLGDCFGAAKYRSYRARLGPTVLKLLPRSARCCLLSKRQACAHCGSLVPCLSRGPGFMWLSSTHSGSRQALANCRQDVAPKGILILPQGRSMGNLKLAQGYR